ncbi:exodeoxyribonuclease V subunit beta [Psychromonas algicola]|uniref:exodeoxyribonuclease V subunit beta n=1 Tax=Psychromonas algicola TaxID=2555642 RepID=UPI001067FFA2|nr:exodeoxyribonuclease V subunit beta [Psychromonas sp. RZ5]TEW51808.1 exodeoxyribonuclease V subunit beta [Psychromonas sp. RZ5]
MNDLNKTELTPSNTAIDISVQPLDALTFPLFGRRLIEASAGTGKTYTIASLFIRLLLGHGKEAQTAHQTPLTVDKILVVTFTEAATAELRGRIRERIRETRLAFIAGEKGTGSSKDPFYQQLIEDSKNLAHDIRLLRFAELQMDEASIFTIHGFCQRMLQQNAFESGSLFQQTLLEDDSSILSQACNDFWRAHFYQLSTPLTSIIYSYWANPEALKNELQQWLSRNDLTFIPAITDFDFEAKYESGLAAINKVKRAWVADMADYQDIITHSGVDKRSYSKKNLPNWFDQVSAWAASNSLDLTLPKNLVKFSQEELHTKTKKGEAPTHTTFTLIDSLLKEDISLKNTLLIKATAWIKDNLQKTKQQHMLLGFDDLLTRLDGALQNSAEGYLGNQIKQQYPIALIDEFQDTDPVQYRIFDTIYDQVDSDDPAFNASGLFMIGDPKQAIYSFRGADIFTYMTARNAVTAHYSLDFNYRSSPDMIDAVNGFFKHKDAAFIYEKDIPFHPVKAPSIKRKKLVVNNPDDSEQKALQFLHINGGLSSDAFRHASAQATVNEIKTLLLLAQKGDAYLEDSEGNQSPILANNISVLVRTGNEANIVRRALLEENINSVYLSLKESVFASTLAQDLLRILTACLHPSNERYLRSTIACKLFSLTPQQIHTTFSDTLSWEAKIADFARYKTVWEESGILVMLQQCFYEQGISAHLLSQNNGERQGERLLTDLLHLSELLQKNSMVYEGAFALLRWFSEQITNAKNEQGEQKQRLESEKELVQVSTLHKSKGLEYDIVFIPFSGLYREPKECLFHDEQQRLVFDLDGDEAHKESAVKELLAEDIRLLYVGLTRSVYRCYLGIGPYKKGRSKASPLIKSALGYLCVKSDDVLQAGDDQNLDQLLQSVCAESEHIGIRSEPQSNEQDYAAITTSPDQLIAPKQFTGKIERNWWVTSYSALSRFHSAPTQEDKQTKKIADESSVNTESVEQALPVLINAVAEKTVFSFPRGAKHGTFLHELFEEIDFQGCTPEQLIPWLTERLTLNNYDDPEQWAPIVSDWVMAILAHPLAEVDFPALSLSQLSEQQKKVEMQFFIPMQPIEAEPINRLISFYDPLSARAGSLQFNQVQGMLKGFIDLTFEFEGQYFIMDYKSNYLGDSLSDYSEQAMADAIVDHRYDFQYQLYTLALHRLLRSRLADYDYEQHIGGVFYTFLRGMQGETGAGVYFTKPKFELIDKLDKLLTGELNAEQLLGDLVC